MGMYTVIYMYILGVWGCQGFVPHGMSFFLCSIFISRSYQLCLGSTNLSCDFVFSFFGHKRIFFLLPNVLGLDKVQPNRPRGTSRGVQLGQTDRGGGAKIWVVDVLL